MDWTTWLIVTLLFVTTEAVNSTNEEEARAYLAYLDEAVCKGKTEQITAEFNYSYNSTDENLEKMEEEDGRGGLFGAKYLVYDWESFNDPDLLRQAKLYGLLDKIVSPALYEEFGEIRGKMVDLDKPEYCLYENQSHCGRDVYPTVSQAMISSHDLNELSFYWKQRQDYLGPQLKENFIKYVNISNMIAIESGFENRADQWMSFFEAPPVCEFEDFVLGLWNEIKDIYLQFYSFYRSRLRKVYGEKAVPFKGPISIALLGYGGLSMNSDDNIYKPYPDKPSIDYTNQLEAQNYTVMDLVKLSEDYYTSMGFEPLPKNFWEKSVFEEPKDRKVDCSGISFDFYNKQDYRMSFCGEVDSFSTGVFVHEMGHLHNFYSYRNQTCCYREPPSPGMDEGSAETLVIPFTSYKHLSRLGLLPVTCDIDPEVIINNLFIEAQNYISILPSILVYDFWRWNIFRNNIKPDDYNKAYWDYKLQFQGVVPPGDRSGPEFLDAGNVIHVRDDTQIISYFFANLYSFQFVEALCIAAGEFDPKNQKNNPLNNCDLYGSKDAGKLLREMYTMGRSKPWTETIKVVTGKSTLEVQPLLNYFKPLYDWLVIENKKNGEYIGWE